MGKHRLDERQAVEATTTAVVDLLKRAGKWDAVNKNLTPEQQKGVDTAVNRTGQRTQR
jgi:hypothetical protein